MASVRLFDAVGRCVLVQAYGVERTAYSVPLDLRALPSGIYLLHLDSPGFSATQKLVVQR